MGLLPFIVFGIAALGMLALIVWTNAHHASRNRTALRTWALQRGHHWDEDSGVVTGGHGAGRFVAELRPQHQFGERRLVPMMTFPGPFALPESEFRHKGLLGLAGVVHRISGLAPLTRPDEAFRARTHDFWGKRVDFLQDAWDRGIHDILAGPATPLAYRVTPQGQLEIYCLKGFFDSWDEQALSEAAVTGERLSALFVSMARR